jgi:ParB family transcriptional regulator, chromosome partitioning protein
MAKRRRLTPPETPAPQAAPETKARFPLGIAPTVTRRPPVAQIAGDAASRSALETLTREIAEAREAGRLAVRLPLDRIAEDHLVRDRLTLDADEMAALKASLSARGQQTPIEVVEAGEGRYGLISGWRRVTALRELGQPTVLAVVRRPEGAAEAYQAMVEENEIREPLSFWERAHVAVTAVRLGIHPDIGAAVAALFAHSPRARRSKIASFARLHEAFGEALRFPTAIPERLGLALASALDRPGFAAAVRDALRRAEPLDGAAERRVLERVLKGRAEKPAPAAAEVAPGIALKEGKGRLTLSGPGVDAALARDLAAWLAARA